MKFEIEFDPHAIQLELPVGAVRASQWLRHGDHPAVKQDYLPDAWDGDFDNYFITQGNEYLVVERGDWIIDMADGSIKIIKGESPPLEDVFKDALRKAVDNLFPRNEMLAGKAWPTYDYD